MLVFAFRFLSLNLYHIGTVILLENVRFHIEEEGKGVDSGGREVAIYLDSCDIIFHLFYSSLVLLAFKHHHRLDFE